MPYPTNALARTLSNVDSLASDIKRFSTQSRDRLAAGNTVATVIIDVAIRLNQAKTELVSAASVPGLPEYAKQQKNNQSLDVIAEFTSMTSAIDGVISWILTNFPKDAGGFLLRETWGPNGPVDRVFAPAQTAGLRTQLDTLIATIE